MHVKENISTSDSIEKIGVDKSPKENIFLYEISPLVNVLREQQVSICWKVTTKSNLKSWTSCVVWQAIATNQNDFESFEKVKNRLFLYLRELEKTPSNNINNDVYEKLQQCRKDELAAKNYNKNLL